LEGRLKSPLLGHALRQQMTSLTHVSLNTLFLRSRKKSPASLICSGWMVEFRAWNRKLAFEALRNKPLALV
jgi:hypothetical protein